MLETENNLTGYMSSGHTMTGLMMAQKGAKANASDVYNKTDSDTRYLQNSKIVILTQAEYDALLSKDPTVFYMIKEG